MAMNLHLELKLARERISTGEDCWVEYSVANRGENDSILFDPGAGRDHAPVFFLRTPFSEQELPLGVGRPIPADVLTLPPGQQVAGAFRLDSLVPLAAGSYQLRAALDPAGMNLASNAVRFEVEPFRTGTWDCVPFGLPVASRVYFSWIRDGRYNEQALSEGGGVDDPPFVRQGVVGRAAVPADAREPVTVLGAVHAGDDNPLRWIFWRVGQTVHSAGPALDQPLAVTLPEGTGPMAGVPLMGARHRADLFYGAGGALTIARFCDPYATPGEASRVLATATLPEGSGLPAFALDPPAWGSDRRHIVTAVAAPGRIAVHHAVLGGDGALSPFRRYEWEVARDFRALADSRPAIELRRDGPLRVRFLCGDREHARKAYVVDVELADGRRAPTLGETLLAAAPRAGRAALGPARVLWWLEDGSVVGGGEEGLRVIFEAEERKPPRDPVVLTGGVYLPDAGPGGLTLVAVG